MNNPNLIDSSVVLDIEPSEGFALRNDLDNVDLINDKPADVSVTDSSVAATVETNHSRSERRNTINRLGNYRGMWSNSLAQNSSRPLLLMKTKTLNKQTNPDTTANVSGEDEEELEDADLTNGNGNRTKSKSTRCDVSEVQKMEQSLIKLMNDFHDGRLRAFGPEITFDQMERVREKQEKLARLHFDLNGRQEVFGYDTEEGRRAGRDMVTQLMTSVSATLLLMFVFKFISYFHLFFIFLFYYSVATVKRFNVSKKKN